MQGICAIIHNNGWAITNESVFDTDKHLIEIDGQRISKNVITIKATSIFERGQNIQVGDKVEVLFKTDENEKYAFIGTIKLRGKQLTVIHELLKSNRYNEILKKIKDNEYN